MAFGFTGLTEKWRIIPVRSFNCSRRVNTDFITVSVTLTLLVVSMNGSDCIWFDDCGCLLSLGVTASNDKLPRLHIYWVWVTVRCFSFIFRSDCRCVLREYVNDCECKSVCVCLCVCVHTKRLSLVSIHARVPSSSPVYTFTGTQTTNHVQHLCSTYYFPAERGRDFKSVPR